MNRRVPSFLFITALALGMALPSLASARSVQRDPDEYAADLGRWHFVHQRERKAIQTIAREFPVVKAALGTHEGGLSAEERLQRAQTDEWWLTSSALGTTLAAVLYSDGAYAVDNAAGKQSRARQQRTLANAQAIIEYLRTNRSGDFQDDVWESFAQRVQDRAEASLNQGDYADVLRGLSRAHPGMARIFDTQDASGFQAEFERQPRRAQYVVEYAVSAVLRSQGKAAFGRTNGGEAAQAANLEWAIMAADSGRFDSAEMKADALAAQPEKRDEYVRYVLESAAERRFHTVWGWRHVQRVTGQLQDDARMEIETMETWEKEPRPSRKRPVNRCG